MLTISITKFSPRERGRAHARGREDPLIKVFPA